MQRLLMALLLTFVVACSDGIVGSSTVTGTYTLRTVNGSSLPYTVAATGTVIIDDAISLYEGNTFAETSHSRVNGSATAVTKSETGSYSLFGNSITLRSNSGALDRVAIGDGSAMTIVQTGLTMVYKK